MDVYVIKCYKYRYWSRTTVKTFGRIDWPLIKIELCEKGKRVHPCYKAFFFFKLLSDILQHKTVECRITLACLLSHGVDLKSDAGPAGRARDRREREVRHARITHVRTANLTSNVTMSIDSWCADVCVTLTSPWCVFHTKPVVETERRVPQRH